MIFKTTCNLKLNTGICLLAGSILMLSASCKGEKKEASANAPDTETETAIPVVTEVMEFQVQDTIQSGWQTFDYANKSQEVHFILLDKYPEGKTIADGKAEVIPVFQKGMDFINNGDMEAAMTAFGELPEWFGAIKFVGGTGLISPGETAVTTLKMDPGYYLVECYVKMKNGVFHSAMGMLKSLVVTGDSVAYTPPAPDVNVFISSKEGIVVHDSIQPGKQVFAVHFEDQVVYENFVGHDVNLVRLSENASLDTLEPWMNWFDPKGLINPAPEGVTFLGGVNDMPGGAVGYFTATLSPGTYALISEVPSPSEKKLLHVFTLGDDSL